MATVGFGPGRAAHSGRLMNRLLLGLGGALLAAWPSLALAMSPAELAAWLGDGDRVTVIDIRHPSRFEQSHVPGSINLPMPGLAERRLPAMVNVVVVGDGFDVDAEQAAVEALRAQGIPRVEVLDGGMMAWDEAGQAAVRTSGMVEGSGIMSVTPKQVERTVRSGRVGVVLLDLRVDLKGRTPFAQAGLGSLYVIDAPSTATPSQVVQHVLRYRDQARGRVLLLVDDGDGRAEAVGMLLSAAGVKRQAILVGGERALETWGQGEITTHMNGGAP